MQRMMGAAAAAIVAAIRAAQPTSPAQTDAAPGSFRKASGQKRNPGNRKNFRRTAYKIGGARRGPPIVKNPAIAENMNAQHDAWYFKKFGAHPDPY